MNHVSVRRVALLACLMAALAAPSFAQAPVLRASGKPAVFKVTVTKVELFNGTAFVTLFSGSAQLDLVAAAAGAPFPGITNLTFPPGTYSQIRVTFANQFSLSGSLTYNSVTWYTTSTVADVGGACIASAQSTFLAEATIRNPAWGALGDAVVQTITLASPVTVTTATDYQPTLKFDLASALTLWEQSGISYYFALAPITITLQ